MSLNTQWLTIVSSSQYIPHGHCYLWQTPLIWLHVVSDLLIAAAYYSIPIMLVYFVQKRQDVPFKAIFILFSGFILSCGTTHILDVWTLWYPAYWLSGTLKAITALVSIYTATELYPLIPKALAFPAPTQLENLNAELANQIKERHLIEQEVRQLNVELEHRVEQRTADLEAANLQLQREIAERQQTELALIRSKQFSEQITQFTPNILYIYDLNEEQTVYCNRFVSDILGYTPEELQRPKANVLEDYIHSEDQPRVKKHLNRCSSLTQGNFFEIEYRIKDSQGNWHWLNARDTFFEQGSDGKPKQILGIASDITERKKAELELQEINHQLSERLSELEKRTQEMIHLGEMTDFLQACLTVAEAETALADLLKPLFSKSSGAVYVIKESYNLVEAVAMWGDFSSSQSVFQPNECWALRRGSIHTSEKTSPNLYCKHIHQEPCPEATLCLPMMAQGETLGLLYLNFEELQDLTPAKKRLAETVSKQIAISLANLKLRETLQQQSFRDALTGLYNRRYLEATITRELHQASRNQHCLSVMMIDIDYFKSFNDTWGHEAGDRILRAIGQFLQDSIRQSDIACRYGGEELVVIMTNTTLEGTKIRAEEIRQGIKQLKVYSDGQELASISISIGLACFPYHGTNYEQLFRRADEALYQAKNNGRDRVFYFT